MKKYLKLFFVILTCTNLLMADMVFNLGAQQFSNSIEGKFKDSTYDLDKTIVSTPLKFDNGHYIPNVSGSFKVELKEPRAKWGVTFDMDCFLDRRGFGVTLLGKEGNVLTLFFSNKKISIDGKVIKDENLSGYEKIIGSLQSNSKAITIVINGKDKLTIKKPNFKLAYVEMNLGTDKEYYGEVPDKLNGLAISTNSD